MAGCAKRAVRRTIVTVALVLLAGPIASAQEQFDRYNGELIVKALLGGRNLELTHPFSFTDANGKFWPVPVGTVVDGASIPQAFWSVIGGPFEDKYREASVIHDYYCDQKGEPWERVHRVFYDGMRASGVDRLKAKIMYAAVYNFGPRWIGVVSAGSTQLISGHPILLDDARQAIVRYVAENDPSIESIEKFSEQLKEARTVEQLERLLYENVNCSPILSDAGTSSSIGKTVILCGMSVDSKRRAARKNIRILIDQLNRLVQTQSYFLLPAVDDYVDNPSPEKWDKIREWSASVHGLIKLGVASVLKVEDARAQELAPPIDDIFDVLSSRAAMISPILSGPPKSRDEMRDWAPNYRKLMSRLRRKLEPLEDYLQSISQ